MGYYPKTSRALWLPAFTRPECLRETPTESEERIKLLTRVARNLAAVLRAGGTVKDLDPETRDWIEKRDEWDAALSGE